MSYHEFNAFIAEAERVAPHGFQIGEEQFTLPSELPAKIILKSMRLAGKEVAQEQVLSFFDEFFTTILGKEQYDRLLDTGISFTVLQKLIEWIIQQYQEKTPATQTKPSTRKNA